VIKNGASLLNALRVGILATTLLPPPPPGKNEKLTTITFLID